MRGTIVFVAILVLLLSSACARLHVNITNVSRAASSAGEQKERDRSQHGRTIGLEELLKSDQPKGPCKTLNQLKPSPQETDVWCWAATAQAVLKFHDEKVEQCDIVTRVYRFDLNDTNIGTCCSGHKEDAECLSTGWPRDVFNHFGFDFRIFYGPLPPQALANQLCENGPFIYVVDWEGGARHAFLVKGSESRGVPDENMFVDVFDPSTDELTSEPLWTYYGFVHGEYDEYKHFLDYVKIRRRP